MTKDLETIRREAEEATRAHAQAFAVLQALATTQLPQFVAYGKKLIAAPQADQVREFVDYLGTVRENVRAIVATADPSRFTVQASADRAQEIARTAELIEAELAPLHERLTALLPGRTGDTN